MQIPEMVFRTLSNSSKHKLTITPTRISAKVAKSAPEEDLELLSLFVAKLTEEDIDVGNSFRGTLDIRDGRVVACLYNSSKNEMLTITFDGIIKYAFKDRAYANLPPL